jgi:predicted DNA-binding protein
MKGITIKLPEETLRRLRAEARASGRSIAALVRERLDVPSTDAETSVHALTADLAGCLEGKRRSATNARRKFRRS